MGFIKTLIILLIIPTLGYGVSVWVLSSVNKDLANSGIPYTASDLCTVEMISQTPELAPFCNEVQPVLWMQNGSIVSGIAAAALLLLFVVAAIFAGKNRKRIAQVFPPLIFISLLVLSVFILAQGAILAYSAYLVESITINRVHFVIIGLIGIGAFVGCIYLIKASYDLVSKKALPILGVALSSKENSEIFSFVSKLAKKLGAREPDNIVVGLEPNFYVTSSNVQLLGERKILSGETLFLSLPLSRILNKDELSAVIGHELGHFRGQDTYYSQKFSPVYAGLSSAISSMTIDDENAGAADTARLPVFLVLSFMLEVFHKNISSISRKREFEADQAATEVAPAQALGSSLLKISLYAELWNDLQKKVVERMEKGKITRNMSRLFSSGIQYDINGEALPEIVRKISSETVSHPTDSHPPTANRLKALGVELDSVQPDVFLMPAEGSINLIPDHISIEEGLTILQQKHYASLGVQVPEDDSSSYGSIILSALGAHMVLADGKLEQEEIDYAEIAGQEIIEDFDVIEFREYCHYPDRLPSIDKLLEFASDLPMEGKEMVYDYLKKIAGSDGNMSQEEEALLLEVQNSFKLNNEA